MSPLFRINFRREAFRRVTLTVRAGVPHTPEEWMSR